tara:strand:- start:385 stop:702 length:318 start_codon:yes stop_codon:yes gene_type:complete
MKNQKLSGSNPRRKSNRKENNLGGVNDHSNQEAMITQWKNEVASLSYDEALNALDLILEDLQHDNVPVEDLQKHYIRGNIYLNHCENLLKNIEQEVIQLSPESLA